MDRYRNLNAGRVVETIELLQRRIAERFPDSGLSQVAAELLSVGREHAARAARIARPDPLLRGWMFLVIASGAAIGWWIWSTIPAGRVDWNVNKGGELIQAIDAGLGIVLFVLAALALLFSLEIRVKRRRALAAIHELRSIAHIVDMHQLAKDPERVCNAGPDTPSSPKRTLTPFELGRYLDYCSELLALTAKIGALYAQGFDDAEAVGAVDDIEDLTSGLSRKIWQKIMVLDRVVKT
jgi:hypothetical protein